MNSHIEYDDFGEYAEVLEEMDVNGSGSDSGKVVPIRLRGNMHPFLCYNAPVSGRYGQARQLVRVV